VLLELLQQLAGDLLDGDLLRLGELRLGPGQQVEDGEFLVR
jgi:hypothetical protein